MKRDDRSLADAWPILAALANGEPGRWNTQGDRRLSSLTEDAAREIAAEVAAAIIDAAESGRGNSFVAEPLSRLFSGIAHSDYPIEHLPLRAYNCAMRNGANSMRRLATLSVAQLRAWPGAGRLTQIAVLANTAQAALRADPSEEPTNDGEVSASDDRPTDSGVSDASLSGSSLSERIAALRGQLTNRDADVRGCPDRRGTSTAIFGLTVRR